MSKEELEKVQAIVAEGVAREGLQDVIKNRGHFPDDDAAVKLLYLGIRNITGRHIGGDGLIRERGERGTGTYGWIDGSATFTTTASSVIMKKPSTAAASANPGAAPPRASWLARGRFAIKSVGTGGFSCGCVIG